MNLIDTYSALKQIVATKLKLRRIKPWDQFHSDFYLDHTFRRLEHLSSLNLPIQGKSVLEFGAGVGDFTGYFVSRACEITSTDSRLDLVQVIKERYPQIKTKVFNIENDSIDELNVSQIVFAYGILYHISNPKNAIKMMSELCSEMFVLETCVSNIGDISNVVAENPNSYSQASSGIGSRPNRSDLFFELKRYFEFVYIPITQPRHPEFPLDWKSSQLPSLSRAIFICSRNRLENQNLTSELIDSHHPQN